jgi:hypothetical protein
MKKILILAMLTPGLIMAENVNRIIQSCLNHTTVPPTTTKPSDHKESSAGATSGAPQLGGLTALFAKRAAAGAGAQLPDIVQKSKAASDEKTQIGVGTSVPTGATVVGTIFEGTLNQLDALIQSEYDNLKKQGVKGPDKISCGFANNRLNCATTSQSKTTKQLTPEQQRRAAEAAKLQEELAKAMKERRGKMGGDQ